MQTALEHMINVAVRLQRISEDLEPDQSAKTVAVAQEFGSRVGAAIKALNAAKGKAGVIKALKDLSDSATYTIHILDFVSVDVVSAAIKDGLRGRVHPGISGLRTKSTRRSLT